MNTPAQKDKASNQPPQQPAEPAGKEVIKWLDEVIKERRVEEMKRTKEGREYLQAKSNAEKKFLCLTANVDDDRGKPTGAERTICRKKGSGSVVFAWDSREGNLLKKNSQHPGKPNK
jgi:hypothetical protein